MIDTVPSTHCKDCKQAFRPGEWADVDPLNGTFTHSVQHGGCPLAKALGLEEGKALAEQGAAAAFDSLDERLSGWRTEAEKALDLLITQGEDFSSDDISEIAGDPPKPNAMGGLMRSRKQDMEAVGYTQTTRKAGHARVIRVWRKR